MDTAERIFQLLDKSGMEQKKFAELIGSTDKIVSKWRTSGLKSYRKYLPQIAEVLNTTVDYLLSGDEKKPAPAPAPDFLIKFNSLTPESQKEVIAFIEFKHGQESQS
ncbi:XRE family transcriptional regulator [Flavonifractor plautii]|uniref:Helix-turn-helix transcriptional regulator n=1 Tax=Flavonifractor plautii TaxID=292800 RepID=A0AAX1KM05_FLAPL|nr:helix-turn-helix transcriptional regulator [Flavonifractor plautii]ANU40222.1 hypothetical protein A4U99_03710 [Flavonifractor plautii]MCR1922857.1 helix-turn-helix domain-containing protein [Flavonifractor plautii]OXE47047.1 XRE family transcriptional regulator [Flavonifractor plautii]QQR07006.1 helix-turn-helix transcriptional regulator [Flavonifractor plautii]UQA27777.1 helix-turn-helix domain-containing protein [Flavonifractor plautii]